MKTASMQRLKSPAPFGGTSRLPGVNKPVNESAVRGSETRAGVTFKTTSGSIQMPPGSIAPRG